MTMIDAPAGTVIRVFDNPDGRREDDWTELRVKRDIASKVIDSFEQSLEDDDVSVTHHANNGLDGKISRLEVAFEPSGATVDLHEGNNGTQNLVCSLGIDQQITLNFQGHDQCDNDEARSLIEMFDDPDCNTGDDWTRITVKRVAFRTTLGTFERSLENDDLLVEHHHDNGLDGKVSCVRITAP